ncbi:MAG: hypothetical protein M3384_04635 [Acidobacteriota bacterium]|nr:hypothetical protein [Acidobacteriota bacterium]
MFESIKNVVLWNYRRGTWQYDVFCLLIIAFIFLTPKTWFDKRERLSATQTARLIVKKEDFSPEAGALEKKVRELSGNEKAEIVEWHERRNERGEVFYEIDIR